MLSVLWSHRYAEFRRGMLLALAAVGLLFFSAGCSLLSETPSTISTGLYGQSRVPLEFTARTDTADGVVMIALAQGALAIPIPTEALPTAEANCSLYGVNRYAFDPNEMFSSGYILVNLEDPTLEPVWGCVIKRPYPIELLERMGAAMEPPRRVLNYDATLRLVRYGP